MDGSTRRPRAWWAAVLALAVLGGCGTVKRTGTARSGTEQLLLTNAWDDALRQVDFRDLIGVPVYLDTQHVSAVDQGWVVSSIRQAMLAQGVLLRSKPEQAQWIVEARVGAYGTDDYSWLVGVPQVTVPPTLTGMPTGTIPEIPLIKKSDQQAVAKLALFAYERSSGRVVWTSGTQLATTNAKDVYIGGMGPIQSGTLRPQKNRIIGVNIPMISDPGPTISPQTGRKGVSDGTSSMTMPTAPPDAGSFAP
jgi:hypothetical protein